MAVSFQSCCTCHGNFSFIVIEIAQFQYIDVVKYRSVITFHDYNIAFRRDYPSRDIFGIYGFGSFLVVEEKKFSTFWLVGTEQIFFFIVASCQTRDDTKVGFQFAVEQFFNGRNRLIFDIKEVEYSFRVILIQQYNLFAVIHLTCVPLFTCKQ